MNKRRRKNFSSGFKVLYLIRFHIFLFSIMANVNKHAYTFVKMV